MKNLNKSYNKILNRIGMSLLMALFFTSSVFGATAEQRGDVLRGSTYRDVESSTLNQVCTSLITSPSGAIRSDFSLGVEAIERQVTLMTVLIADFNFSPEQAAGVIGNFVVETGTPEMHPDVNQGGARGAPNSNDDGGAGYGWAQWDTGRKTAFLQFSIENGYMLSRDVPATDAANYAWLVNELTNTFEKQVLPKIAVAQTAEEASRIWVDEYERAGTKAYAERADAADLALQAFNADSGISRTATSGCVNGAASIVGDFSFPLIVNKSGIKNANSLFKDGTARGDHNYSPFAYDILVEDGTPVVSVVKGVVVKLGKDKCPGRSIQVYSAENDFLVFNAHLQYGSEEVRVGESVEVGQLLGYTGGEAEGCGTPHLHIDVSNGSSKPNCTREDCPQSSRDLFLDVGPSMFETFQNLPE